MKKRYSMFPRPWGVYYYQDNTTGKQGTLKTGDKDEAYRLVAAKNENEEAPAFNRHLVRVYWKAGDPAGATRTWQHIMDEIPKLKKGQTQHRWLTAIKDKALDSIRNMVILETQAEHFMKVLGGAAFQPTFICGAFISGRRSLQTATQLHPAMCVWFVFCAVQRTGIFRSNLIRIHFFYLKYLAGYQNVV